MLSKIDNLKNPNFWIEIIDIITFIPSHIKYLLSITIDLAVRIFLKDEEYHFICDLFFLKFYLLSEQTLKH